MCPSLAAALPRPAGLPFVPNVRRPARLPTFCVRASGHRPEIKSHDHQGTIRSCITPCPTHMTYQVLPTTAIPALQRNTTAAIPALHYSPIPHSPPSTPGMPHHGRHRPTEQRRCPVHTILATVSCPDLTSSRPTPTHGKPPTRPRRSTGMKPLKSIEMPLPTSHVQPRPPATVRR